MYEEAAVGKNTLSVMVNKMCVEAWHRQKKKTYFACLMFRANFSEKIIQRTAGHRPIEALCTYKRVSTEQQKAVSKVLTT